MLHGRLMPRVISFALPLMLTGVLQLLFNAADMMIVGRYDGSQALAAVGSTGALINLIVNLFMGLSVGASVAVSQYHGAGDHEGVSKVVHTSMTVAVIGGVAAMIIGVCAARPLLALMGSPSDVIDRASLYMRIFFIGMPANMVYNFGAAILRAVGDTRRPLYFLALAGVINVGLNIVFVKYLLMSVAGVALATVISQTVSMVLVVLCLMHADGAFRLDLRRLCIDWGKLGQIVRVGLPAGIQGAMFSISNVLIQSSINSFGSTVMAGSSAASTIEGFAYVSMNSVSQASINFIGQNYGAKRYDRLPKVVGVCSLLVIAVGLITGCGMLFLRQPLLGIFSDDPQVIAAGSIRLFVFGTTYFTCGLNEVFASSLRGLGHSTLPMIISLTGICGLRVLWIYTIFAIDPQFLTLFISYPVSWIATLAVNGICCAIVIGRLRKKASMEAI